MRALVVLYLLFFPLLLEAHTLSCAAVLERVSPHDTPEIVDLRSNPVMVKWQGQTVQLAPYEGLALHVILSTPVATYAELARQVWGKEVVPISTIRRVVMQLREKLQQVDPDFKAILTVFKTGFRWNSGGTSSQLASIDPHEPPLIENSETGPQAHWMGKSVELTLMEAKLLKVLTTHSSCSYELLAELVWENLAVPRSSIFLLIRNLKYKLKAINPNFMPILNVPEVGYRWNWNLDPHAPPQFLEVIGEEFQVRWVGEFFVLTPINVLVWQTLLRHFPATYRDIAVAAKGDPNLSVSEVVSLVADLKRRLLAVAPQHKTVFRVPQVGFQWNWGIDPKLVLAFDSKPDFPSFLELDPSTNFVKWKGRVFQLFPREFMALVALVRALNAPLISEQRLFDDVFGKGGKPFQVNAISELMKNLVEKFRTVDPAFSAIERVFDGKEWTYMWMEQPLPSVETLGGRLRIARFVPLVWFDGKLVQTKFREYFVLRKIHWEGQLNLAADPHYETVVADVNAKLRSGFEERDVLREEDRIVRFTETTKP